MFCVRPPLKEPPEGDYCNTCLPILQCHKLVFLALQAPGAVMSACTDLAESKRSQTRPLHWVL